eukprot:TRINITY_DN4119_c0_g1_i3.p1 TRINITY_DN4119_c0_g1~~TRINITY_DN4119_c0_g1_i3.p1  ORF type:complete len:241 (-),score=66.05 TRINITY_DN4119_c0_g1_i3:320-943(-)
MSDVAEELNINAGEPLPTKGSKVESVQESSAEQKWSEVKTAVSTGIHAAIDAISHKVHHAAEAVKSAIGVGETPESEAAEEEEVSEEVSEEEKEGAPPSDDKPKPAKPRRKKQKKTAAEAAGSSSAMVQEAIRSAQTEVAERRTMPLTVERAAPFIEPPHAKQDPKAIPSTYNPPEPQHLDYDERGRGRNKGKDGPNRVVMPRAQNH